MDWPLRVGARGAASLSTDGTKVERERDRRAEDGRIIARAGGSVGTGSCPALWPPLLHLASRIPVRQPLS